MVWPPRLASDAPFGLLIGFDLKTHGSKSPETSESRHIATPSREPKSLFCTTDGELEEIFTAITANASPSTSHVSPIHVFPVPSFTDDSSGASSESDRLQHMKDRIAQMEKDMRGIYALAAIIRKKNELAADAERYALAELQKAT
ncbi:hypothetical protein QYE76_065825 [Lolium multiflorum]|uniref:Uncharacterized protein n=1 Tax=Lolium multiflorum TaxID=4521 RepID=A0AAD8WAA2_LOLMU|nr:hypothetical protein QYE76_065825 [Lolium multiflorum]